MWRKGWGAGVVEGGHCGLAYGNKKKRINGGKRGSKRCSVHGSFVHGCFVHSLLAFIHNRGSHPQATNLEAAAKLESKASPCRPPKTKIGQLSSSTSTNSTQAEIKRVRNEGQRIYLMRPSPQKKGALDPTKKHSRQINRTKK